MFQFLRSIGLWPLEFSEVLALTGTATPYTGQGLDAGFRAARAVVVLFTPDEIAYLQSQYADHDSETRAEAQPRPNVLFEAGMAFGLHPDRTVLVELGHIRPISDMAGRHVVRLSNTPRARMELVQRLQTAGCRVNTTGTDWIEAGDFTPPEAVGGTTPVGKRVPSKPSPEYLVDAKFLSGTKSVHRIQILNRGSRDLFNVMVELPENCPLQWFGDAQTPQPKLPAWKSYTVEVFKGWQSPGPAAFDITVTATTEEGAPFSQTAFIDTSE